MQDNGRLGAYATAPNYKTSIKNIYNGIMNIPIKNLLTQ
jgi:hypothetical protein